MAWTYLLIAGLLEVGPDVTGPALGPEPFISARAAGHFLASAVEFFGGVVDLFTQTHRDLLFGKAGAACCRGGHFQSIDGGPGQPCPACGPAGQRMWVARRNLRPGHPGEGFSA